MGMIDVAKLGTMRRAGALLCGALFVSTSLAGTPATLPGVFNGPPPSYGHDFVTITHAGNRDLLESERIEGTAGTGRPSLGGVNYQYRIGRTEITATQWISFIKLAWPVAQEIGYASYDTEITSSHILNTSAFGAPNYIITPGRENFAVNVSWRMAAMYCNWLHNGAPTGPNVNLDVFRRGAYDTVTFTRPTAGQPWIEQATRSEGALFWIPTLDEWIKAVYYDPNRYGEGQEGYWYYPYGNERPVFGFVGQPGAQTGPVQGGQAQGQPPVGSFPNALTPWGLLDAAGSLSEWTEDRDLTFPALRMIKGSSATGSPGLDGNDRLWFGDSVGSTYGFRIASAVPGTGTLSVFIAMMATGARRARKCAMSSPASSPSANPSPLAGEGSVARQRGVRGLALVTLSLLLSSTSLAGTPATLPGVFNGAPPSYGLDFVTITHAGNRDMLPSERVYNNPFNFASQVNVGAVPYEYRIGRTEITSAQWLPFIQRAWPVFLETGVDLYSSASSGRYIIATATGPGNPNYVLLPGGGNFAPSVNFRAAAIYCNWLHNGAPTGPNLDLNVFRQGVYDTSTFTRNPDGSYNDQINRAEGALFWIPTLDEWTKAVFYDPNRYGQGQDGYWRYTYGNEPPVYGEVGDPLAQWGTLNGEQPPIGSFPNALTPWGLLDAAGSVAEWTDTSVGIGNPSSRYVRGSSSSGGSSSNANDGLFLDLGPLGLGGIRIASAVPAPSSILSLSLIAFGFTRRRRAVIACASVHSTSRTAVSLRL